MAGQVKDSPEVRTRLVRAMIPIFVGYAALAVAGLYFLIDDRFLPGIGFLLAAHALAYGFHLWSRRVRSENPARPQP
jgi:hypothetical protein